MIHVACVNQDPGIAPTRAKGAAIHLAAMRRAFSELGAAVESIDEADQIVLLDRLEALHSAGRLDMIYERYSLGSAGAAEFARIHETPFVVEVNAPLAQEASRWRDRAPSRADSLSDSLVFGQANRVVAVSSQVAAYAIGRGAAADRVAIFPNGIDRHLFHPLRAKDSVRGELVPEDRFVVGFHGRPRPWHGFAHLVQVCRQLLDDGVPIHLLAVGEGEFEALESIPAQHRTRVGWRPHGEMPRYVAAFDALPLTYEPDVPLYFSPLKLMEAMACGVVPLVPAAGDLPQLVRHQETGMVYPHGDFHQLAEQLQWLIAHPQRRSAMARRSAALAARYTWTRVAEFVLRAAYRSSSHSPQSLAS